MKCDVCGAEFSDDKKKCPMCGSKPVCEGQRGKIKTEKVKIDAEETQEFLKYVDFVDNSEALLNLGLCTYHGIGTEKNTRAAFRYFQRAASLGNDRAQYYTALSYEEGSGTEKDIEQAKIWYRLSAAQKNREALNAIELRFPELRVKVTREEVQNADIDQAVQSVMMLRCGSEDGLKSQGTAFILKDGRIVTCAHVILNEDHQPYESIIGMLGGDASPYLLKPLCTDISKDIAVLKFAGITGRSAARGRGLNLSEQNGQFGEDIYIVGNPLGIGLSVSKGIISSPERKVDFLKVDHVIQTDISANTGDSGGPLISKDGEILGMMTFISEEGRGGMSFCVPSCEITAVLEKLYAAGIETDAEK